MDNNIYVDVKNLTKTFKDHNNNSAVVFKDVNFLAKAGEITIIRGKSGCGKSTLLNILSTIDNKFDNGSVYIMQEDISTFSESKKATFRNEHIGFIFQSHELIAEFNILENCSIPLKLKGMDQTQAYKEAAQLLDKFGISEESYMKFPRELSGGQQQRVGIARAMINKPDIIFADEPTANLDEISKEKVNEYMKTLINDGTALVIVTHDSAYESESFSHSVYNFIDGTLVKTR